MIRRTLFVVLALFALTLFSTACSRSQSSSSSPALKELSVEDVAARIAANDGKTFVYDNNDSETYAQGHVPTAKWVAFDAVTAADLPADKNATLVFYCAHEL